MAETYIENINGHGSVIDRLIETIKYRDIETGFGSDEYLVDELNMLWYDIKNNARFILDQVRVQVPGIGIPDTFEVVAESCDRNNEWRSYSTIGTGRVGSTYAACKVNNCNYVIKRQPIAWKEADLRKASSYVEYDSFKSEVTALIALQKWKHAPKIYAAWTCNGYGYIVMEKLYNCDLSNRYHDVVTMIDELFQIGWVHTDAHQTNILCRDDGELVLIDYGRARSFTDENEDGFMSPHAWDTMSDELYTPVRVREIELHNIAVNDYGMDNIEEAVQIITTDQYDV